MRTLNQPYNYPDLIPLALICESNTGGGRILLRSVIAKNNLEYQKITDICNRLSTAFIKKPS